MWPFYQMVFLQWPLFIWTFSLAFFPLALYWQDVPDLLNTKWPFYQMSFLPNDLFFIGLLAFIPYGIFWTILQGCIVMDN